MVKYREFIILIVCSYFISKVLYNSYQRDNIFALILYCILGAIWLYCFGKIIKEGVINYRTKRKFLSFWKTFISLFSLVPAIIIFNYFESRLNVPSLLQADRHGVYADFKTNGTYFIRSGSWGSKKHFYGKYHLYDSIIELDRSGLDDVLISNRFLLKHSNPEEEKKKPDNDRLSTPEYLIQINKSGAEIKARYMGRDTTGVELYIPYRFEITMDNKVKKSAK
ncbi:hypothetical protein A4H97_23860 [Niastella yeongjuensis]|uniref:Uncharacterized protein n=1 Tax=Niastella yeongjuensis TaxID=354355 RepID=A0A1V9F506_9BACT|nr:hypothetical protein [Niastella yeongjuensis]OQP53479.1 hypothetical protein A4H97_23860 [Niastella yeongjuensis]SEP11227.1 hypothetical protein SAMN05660816_04427 [Niastella yeongjuensis]